MKNFNTTDELIKEIIKQLPCIYDEQVTDEYKETHFLTSPDQTEILSASEKEIETLANFFDQLYGTSTCITGYCDPAEAEKNDEVDAYTGLYFLSIR